MQVTAMTFSITHNTVCGEVHPGSSRRTAASLYWRRKWRKRSKAARVPEVVGDVMRHATRPWCSCAGWCRVMLTCCHRRTSRHQGNTLPQWQTQRKPRPEFQAATDKRVRLECPVGNAEGLCELASERESVCVCVEQTSSTVTTGTSPLVWSIDSSALHTVIVASVSLGATTLTWNDMTCSALHHSPCHASMNALLVKNEVQRARPACVFSSWLPACGRLGPG